MKKKRYIIKKVKLRIIKKWKSINDGIILRKIKQCFRLSLSFVKALLEIFIPKKYDDTYVSLTPIKDADKDGIYCNALKFALDNGEIKNIAIAGNYGSGKSSVIKTFFEKIENKKYNPIYVSLAAFNKNDYLEESDKSNGNDGKDSNKIKENQNRNEFYHTLEKSILQQLIYQANERDVPLSRFRRINKHSKLLLNIETIAAIAGAIFLISILFPNIIPKIQNNYINIVKQIPKEIVNFLASIFLILVYLIVYKILFLITTKVNISRFKIKDAEVEIDDKPESIFNKYLDEIIYFFQAAEHSVVVIEDLDRYEGNASFIFQKLRELNILINSSNQVKYEVDFIFAIRDDFFENYEERTKFFDYIIPIIPISSNGNSNEIMWKRLEYLRETEKISYKFDKNFINDISIMIEDKRLIDSIINEFIIYKNKFNNEHMDDKQLFSIIMYKNICPKSYANLQKDNGNIVEIFKNKKIKLNKIIEELEDKKNQLINKKDEIKKESLKNIKELKFALISSIYNFDQYTNYERKFELDNRTISINEFINLDIEKISNSTISFKTEMYSYIHLDEEGVFRLFGNKSIFINRWKNIEKGKEVKLEELQNAIEEIDLKIRNIEKLTIKQLISQYGTEDIYGKNTKSIEKFLITKGYITEEYKDYITLFVPGNLSKEDNEFFFAVKTGETLPYDYKLNNIKNIMKKLNESDFEEISILNFELLNYLVTNNNFDKVLKIIQLLDTSSEDTLQFIDGFVERYTSSNSFINVLIENSTVLWRKIYKKIGNNQYIDKWIMRFLENEKSLKYVDEEFIEYINKHKYIDKYVKSNQIEIIINSFKKCNIRLSNIQQINNADFLRQVCINKLYELNTTMLKLFLELNGNDIREFEEKNLTIIMNFGNEIKEFVLENFEEYFNLCYSLNKSNEDEKDSIVEILNNQDINIDIKKQIIRNERFDEYNIKDLDKELINTLIDEDKIKVDYNNILEIIVRENELKTNLINYISKHINEYSKQNINECESGYDREIIDLFIRRFIFCNEVTFDDFKILVKTFNKKLNKMEEIEGQKLEYLIDNEIIEFNLENYDFIRNKELKKLLNFIINNIEQFVQNINEYNISEIQDELLVNKELDKEYKNKIVENVEIAELDNNTIIQLVFDGILVLEDESIIERILEDSEVLIKDKVDILKMVLKNIDDVQKGTEYIHLIGNGYEDINTNKNACNISLDKIDIELCNILKAKGYVSSYKKGKKHNVVLYNKVNRI